MLRRFSDRIPLIVSLRSWGVDRDGATDFVNGACDTLGVARPDVSFHGRRGAHTGYTRAPRMIAVANVGEAPIRTWEHSRKRAWPAHGMIRLGDPTSLGTLAHEIAHHCVFLHEPVRTPAHGKVWVRWFDRTAGVIAAMLDANGAGRHDARHPTGA